jgi:hypothetical protein
MIRQKQQVGHSDQAPSSKDWQPGAAGRDEDFTPEKDLWTRTHKGNLGAGRPGEDIQPGTGHEGKSWRSEAPDPDDLDEQLDEALKDTFPASDPPEPAQPGVTGWDLDDEAVQKAGGKRKAS